MRLCHVAKVRSIMIQSFRMRKEMDAKEIQKVYALERGKIYCLQMDLNAANWDHIEAIVKVSTSWISQ